LAGMKYFGISLIRAWAATRCFFGNS
jgi:hypothetical protein